MQIHEQHVFIKEILLLYDARWTVESIIAKTSPESMATVEKVFDNVLIKL